jgi:L-lactate dehydrogenase complex protein LldE
MPELPKVQAFCDRVYELTWFLVHVMQIKLVDKGEPIKVTWHGSCHSMREMGVVEEPKELLRSLSNVTLVEADYEKECCGFGGTFAVRMPELSGAIVADKVANITATGATEVLSGDMGCMMNITGALKKVNSPVRGRHIAEFLLERTAKGDA